MPIEKMFCLYVHLYLLKLLSLFYLIFIFLTRFFSPLGKPLYLLDCDSAGLSSEGKVADYSDRVERKGYSE